MLMDVKVVLKLNDDGDHFGGCYDDKDKTQKENVISQRRKQQIKMSLCLYCICIFRPIMNILCNFKIK